MNKSNTSKIPSTQGEWVLKFIETYGYIDGAHHKAWLLDQISRVVNGTPVKISYVLDSGYIGFDTAEPSPAYLKWVSDIKNGEDGPETYCYDIGIAP